MPLPIPHGRGSESARATGAVLGLLTRIQLLRVQRFEGRCPIIYLILQLTPYVLLWNASHFEPYTGSRD
jgi:hypothetical protein